MKNAASWQSLDHVWQEYLSAWMDRHRPLIAALFAGMYSRATTENDGRRWPCKTADAFEPALFGKRPTKFRGSPSDVSR